MSGYRPWDDFTSAVAAAQRQQKEKYLTPRGGGGPYAGPGDIIPSSTWQGFWGGRAFSFATIGMRALRLRRSPGNQEQDFVTTKPKGDLDYPSIASFQGISSLFIVRYYDQTGNGHDIAPASVPTQVPFTLNVLNGRGMYDNSSLINAAYQTSGPVDWGPVTPRSVYSCYLDKRGNHYGMLIGDIGEGDALAANPNIFFNSADTDKVAWESPGTELPALRNQFHVAVGASNNGNPGPFGYSMVDGPNARFADYNNTGEGNLVLSVWGGNFAGDQLQGYGVEAGWAQPINWTPAQAAALMTNVRAFWGF